MSDGKLRKCSGCRVGRMPEEFGVFSDGRPRKTCTRCAARRRTLPKPAEKCETVATRGVPVVPEEPAPPAGTALLTWAEHEALFWKDRIAASDLSPYPASAPFTWRSTGAPRPGLATLE